ncbi:MAG: hypothetical protein IH995_03540 [Proteobacteria bacterium]|nr:hypothetical protein [Pseudomonadota bacterium]
MTVSQTPPMRFEGKQLKRTGTFGIAIGALAILVCELPIILAVLGLGGLSAGAMALLRPIIEIFAIIEIFSIIIAIVGAVLLLFVLVRHIITLQKRSQP